jgi:hypothetical protein
MWNVIFSIFPKLFIVFCLACIPCANIYCVISVCRVPLLVFFIFALSPPARKTYMNHLEMRINCFCLIRYSTGKRSLPQAARERNQAEVGVNPFICLLPTYRYRKQLLSPIFWSMSRTNIFGFSFPSRFANSPFCAHFLYLTKFPKLYLFSSSFLLPLYRTVLSFLKGVNNI